MNTNEAGKVDISPLPWKWDGDDLWHVGESYSSSENAHEYTGIRGDYRLEKSLKYQANKEYVLEAVNTHAALIAIAEAAKEAISVLERAACGDCDVNHQNQAACANHEICQALAAYAKLKEGGG